MSVKLSTVEKVCKCVHIRVVQVEVVTSESGLRAIFRAAIDPSRADLQSVDDDELEPNYSSHYELQYSFYFYFNWISGYLTS